MGKVTIPADDPVELVGEHQAREDWKLQVEDANILVDHARQQVAQIGDRIKAGDRVRLEELRGQPVYAIAEKEVPATAWISRDALSIRFMTRDTVGAVQSSDDRVAPPSSDDWDEATGSGVDIGSGGSTSVTLTPPGRSDQVMMRVEGGASFDVGVTWNNTSETYSGDASTPVEEVVPVYYISDNIDIQITDTSGGANTVSYDMVVV